MKKFAASFLTLLSLPCCLFGRTAPKIDLDTVKKGIVFFTFDDRNFNGWLKAMPIFRKYDAFATFLVCGNIDKSIIPAMKRLIKDGHTVGLHSINHNNAPDFIAENGAEKYLAVEILPQLEACKKAGIKVSHFAYPNNRRTPETDALLSKYFKRFRAGCAKPKDIGLLDHKPFFRDIAELKNSSVMPGAGIGEYYSTTEELLRAVLAKAAKENKAIVFFSHDIAPKANRISMDTAILEMCLKTAKELGMKIASFDQIP